MSHVSHFLLKIKQKCSHKTTKIEQRLLRISPIALEIMIEHYFSQKKAIFERTYMLCRDVWSPPF